MAERNAIVQTERINNLQYISAQKLKDEKDKNKQQEDADKRVRDRLDNQEFLRRQMEDRSGVAIQGTAMMQAQKKFNLGGMMNPEEARMNR